MLKIILALVLGSVVTSVWIMYDPRFLTIAHAQAVNLFKDQYGARFCADRCKLRPLSLSIVFENPHVESLSGNRDWYWKADQLKIQIHPLTYLYSRVIGLSISVMNVCAHTSLKQGIPAIQPHVESLFKKADSAVPIDLTYVALDNLKVSFKEDAFCFGFIKGSIEGEKQGSEFVTNVEITDGLLAKNNKDYLKNVVIDATMRSSGQGTDILTVAYDGSWKSPLLQDERYHFFVKGSWDGTEGTCMINTKDHSILVHPCAVSKNADGHYIFSAQVAVAADIFKMFAFPTLQDQLEGSCLFSLQGSTAGDVQAKCILKNLLYKGYGCQECTLTCVRDGDDIQGLLHADIHDTVIDGEVTWSLLHKKGTCKLTNTTAAALHGYWEIPRHQFEVQAEYSADTGLLSHYSGTAYHNKTREKVSLSGSVVEDDTEYVVRGVVASHAYMLHITKYPFLIKSGVYTDQDGQELMTGLFTDPSHFVISMNYDMVRTIAYSWYDSFLPGKGMCTITGVFENNNLIGSVTLTDGLIRLPGMYNFISNADLQITYNFEKKVLIGENLTIHLHSGQLESKRLTVAFAHDQAPFFVHIPLIFKHCFMNIKKQMYGVFSGAFVYAIDDKKSSISGFGILENGMIRDNIFSEELYATRGTVKRDTPSLFDDIALNFSFKTAHPISIVTPVLELQANVACSITNTSNDPHIAGTIQLQEGKITFPAHELSITRGMITLVPYQGQDHTLDIVAQGRIKKYVVMLALGGSLHDPTITLQSTPSLTQEQIMMLLFGGTEQESLNVMAPALVYNVQNFLFSKTDEYSALKENLVPPWLKPFERISFIPRFTEQTGRGGLKGVIEVDVNDRLRAAVEKNFSLSENASAEVEYLLSDDISLKVNKDDRSDLGAEVEMRFKF